MAEHQPARRREVLRRRTTSSASSISTSSDGEFVVLLGPSGCGKTTTLRAIAGLEEIDSGDILIDGKAVQRLRAAERDIAFVFQLFALYPHLTAYDNIAFPLRAQRPEPKRRSTRGCARWRRRCGIEQLLELAALGAVRRRHAARRHRPRAGAPAQGDADGRADRRARRQAAREHAHRAEAPASSRTTRPPSTSPTTRSRRCRSPTASRS